MRVSFCVMVLSLFVSCLSCSGFVVGSVEFLSRVVFF